MSRDFHSPGNAKIQNKVIENQAVHKKANMLIQHCIYYRNERDNIEKSSDIIIQTEKNVIILLDRCR